MTLKEKEEFIKKALCWLHKNADIKDAHGNIIFSINDDMFHDAMMKECVSDVETQKYQNITLTPEDMQLLVEWVEPSVEEFFKDRKMVRIHDYYQFMLDDFLAKRHFVSLGGLGGRLSEKITIHQPVKWRELTEESLFCFLILFIHNFLVSL